MSTRFQREIRRHVSRGNGPFEKAEHSQCGDHERRVRSFLLDINDIPLTLLRRTNQNAPGIALGSGVRVDIACMFETRYVSLMIIPG